MDHRAPPRLAVAGLEHLAYGRLRGDESAAHVEREQLVEMRIADIDEELRDVAAGIVDQDIELLQPADRGADRLSVRHVADHRLGAAAALPDLPGHFVEFRGGPAHQDDLGAGFGQRQRSTTADAAAGAGDEGHTAVDAEGRGCDTC